MTGKTILIVEDEQDIVELITYNLEREGFRIDSAGTGEDGLKTAKANSPDLILLDLMLPGMNGLDVCRVLKADDATCHIPVIILTARDEDVDMVTGLEVGADDYVTKPFSPRVLIARVRAMLRRHEATREVGSPIHVGEVTIDPGRHRVIAGGKSIEFTFTEFKLLVKLARHPGWVFSRSQLIDELRDDQYVIADRAIDVQVANLRKKLGEYGHYIQTVRGVGYRMQEIP
ncbi:MAG: response regulator transcription factor [candidate division Zixibacteria bacterium]|nr:response regulator transcription factor [candidate division Zixibacteria bacterium]